MRWRRRVCTRYGGVIQRKENGLQEERGLSIAGEGGIGDVTRALDRYFNVDEANIVLACVCWKRQGAGERDREEENGGRDESQKHSDRGVIDGMTDEKDGGHTIANDLFLN